MTEQSGDPRLLIEHVAKALVDAPDQVSVDQFEDGGETVVELTVAENDVGKVIGRQGRTARAMRHLLNAASVKSGKRLVLDILE